MFRTYTYYGFLVVFALAAFASPVELAACGVARQYRRIPLGLSAGSRLVLLQLKLYRYWDQSPDESGESLLKNAWDGEANLLILNKQGKSEQLVYLGEFKNIPDPYGRSLAEKMRAALKVARRLPGFVPAESLVHYFCDYKRKCLEHSFQAGSKNRFMLYTKRGPGRSSREIVLPAPLLAHLKRSDMYRPADYARIFYPGGKRVLKAGDKTIVSFSFASGDFRFGHSPAPVPNGAPRCPLYGQGALRESERRCVFTEPIPHHGTGFDFVYVEQGQ